jgi:hypothetical protein
MPQYKVGDIIDYEGKKVRIVSMLPNGEADVELVDEPQAPPATSLPGAAGYLARRGERVNDQLGHAYDSGKNLLSSLNPLTMVEALPMIPKLAAGTAQLALPESMIPKDWDYRELPRAVGRQYAERYGGLDNISKTLHEDPFGVLRDAVSIASLGRGAVRGVGRAATRLTSTTRGAGLAQALTTGSKLYKGLQAVEKLDPVAAIINGPVRQSIRKAGDVAYFSALNLPKTFRDKESMAKLQRMVDYGQDNELRVNRAGGEAAWKRVSDIAEGVDRASRGGPHVTGGDVWQYADTAYRDYAKEMPTIGANTQKEFARLNKRHGKMFDSLTELRPDYNPQLWSPEELDRVIQQHPILSRRFANRQQYVRQQFAKLTPQQMDAVFSRYGIDPPKSKQFRDIGMEELNDSRKATAAKIRKQANFNTYQPSWEADKLDYMVHSNAQKDLMGGRKDFQTGKTVKEMLEEEQTAVPLARMIEDRAGRQLGLNLTPLGVKGAAMSNNPSAAVLGFIEIPSVKSRMAIAARKASKRRTRTSSPTVSGTLNQRKNEDEETALKRAIQGM